MRTTLDIDEPVLRELKRRQRAEGKSLGKVASELLARALAEPGAAKAPTKFAWIAQAMGARVDLADKEALYQAMDADA
ncbi:MAG: hypothetical protein L0219_16885 [Phycisphaerales bacterium]|nr:hypothetical protein [Phycisphaerales bacterium]